MAADCHAAGAAERETGGFVMAQTGGTFPQLQKQQPKKKGGKRG